MYTKGHYEFNVKITDADGKTCYASKSTDFRGLYFVITPAVAGPQKVGTTVDFSVELFNYYYYKFPNYTYWSVTKNGETYKCEDKGYKMSFTPTEAGDYEITFNMPTYMGTAVSETINYKIIDENSNVATVYYKNTSWDNANIHFKPDNGSWTTAPEVKMEASDIEDYTWKYSIDLGDTKAATVCFNDGNGNWDSNYGQNYRIEAGRYGVSDSKVSKIEEKKFEAKLSVDKGVGGTYNPSKFSVTTKNGKAVKYTYYIYKYGSKKSVDYGISNTTFPEYTFNTYNPGDYTVEVEVTDEDGNIATDKIDKYVVEGPKFEYFKTNVTGPQRVGECIKLETKFVNQQPDSYNSYSFEIKRGNGSEYYRASVNDGIATITWIPAVEGTYQIKDGKIFKLAD